MALFLLAELTLAALAFEAALVLLEITGASLLEDDDELSELELACLFLLFLALSTTMTGFFFSSTFLSLFLDLSIDCFLDGSSLELATFFDF